VGAEEVRPRAGEFRVERGDGLLFRHVARRTCWQRVAKELARPKVRAEGIGIVVE
jgi:hypothetical protein